MLKKTVIYIILTLIFISCEKVEEHSDIPEITFKDFEVKTIDTELGPTLYGIIIFDFIDGNGDIGFKENSDTIISNNISDIIIKEFNPDGVLLKDTVGPYYLPYFDESSYGKSLKGEIKIKMPKTFNYSDTVYYEFYIVDRENNHSNTITTPIYIYSEMEKQ